MILQGGKSSSLGQNPKFKIIEVDAATFLPIKSTLYEYRLDLLEADPTTSDLITPILTYPTTFTSDMSNMSPTAFKALADKIKSDETEAVRYLK